MRQRCEFRASNRGCVGRFDFREEAVAAPSNGFHKTGTFGRIAKGLTDFVDRFVEPVVGIHESIRGPKFLLKFFASYDLSRVFKKHRQHLEGLFLKPNAQAVLVQFSSAKIQFENSKTEPPAKLMAFSHGEVNFNRARVYHRAELTGNTMEDSFV
jgi:hypothetical protein